MNSAIATQFVWKTGKISTFRICTIELCDWCILRGINVEFFWASRIVCVQSGPWIYHWDFFWILPGWTYFLVFSFFHAKSAEWTTELIPPLQCRQAQQSDRESNQWSNNFFTNYFRTILILLLHLLEIHFLTVIFLIWNCRSDKIPPQYLTEASESTCWQQKAIPWILHIYLWPQISMCDISM